jgi:hypothetical protein
MINDIDKDVMENKVKNSVVVEITLGNIKNSHMYLRSCIDFFPEDCIGGPNKATKAESSMTLEFEKIGTVETDIDGSKVFFRNRSYIKQFLELHDVAPGEKVEIEKITPYQYKIRMFKN